MKVEPLPWQDAVCQQQTEGGGEHWERFLLCGGLIMLADDGEKAPLLLSVLLSGDSDLRALFFLLILFNL